MVDREYSIDTYKSITVMRNLEMLKIVPDHLKTNKRVSQQLKNYLIY